MNWYEDEEKPMTDVTISELDALCDAIQKQREACDEISEKHKEQNKLLDSLEQKLVSVLKSLGRDNYKTKTASFSIAHRTSVRVPQGDERITFFEYLKERGLYEGLITVNSQTLNSFYKSEYDKADEEGRLQDFKIPGLDEPTIKEILSVRKNKQ